MQLSSRQDPLIPGQVRACSPWGARRLGARAAQVAWAVLVASLITPSAAADVDGAKVLRILRRPEQHRGLADRRGKLPVLVALPIGASAASRGLLPVAPGFGAAHLSPSELARFVQDYPDSSPRVAPPRRPQVDMASIWTSAATFRERSSLDGSGVVVGVIDTGLDVLHPDFRNADGSTRVLWLMTGDEPFGLHPELEARYGCTDPASAPCAILSGADIDALLANSVGDDEPRDRSGHGTHVTSIAAGNGGIMLEADPRFVGMAPGAGLIIAAPSMNDEFSDPTIVNAARFIYEQAESMGMPAVVNISLGSDFGPHDGTSGLEKALAALLGAGQLGRAMVVAAGNSGDRYFIDDAGPFGVHTEVHVSPNAVSRVPMTVPAYEGTLTGAGYVWITFRPGDEVAVGLEGPDGADWVSLTDPGEEAGFEEDEASGGVINNKVSDESALAVDTNGAIVTFDGSWEASEQVTVLLQGRGDAQLWVSGVDEFAPGPLSFGLMFEKATTAGTIGVPATHPDLVAVGCTLNRAVWRPWGESALIGLATFGGIDDPVPETVCYFSGAGPTATGRMKPDLVAPGAFVAGAMSRDADPRNTMGGLFGGVVCPSDMPYCTMLDERHAMSSGTSMAAPHVAGAMALLLQLDPALRQAQLLELLQAGAEYPHGTVPYEYQIGPGSLELMGTLQVLEEAQSQPLEADPGQSYFVLSSPYVRPDPSWPVEGVVQLRRADEAVAVGLDGQHLSLHVDGGVVLQPLTRVRAGMWRFSISAPRGSGGTVVRVSVRYRGQAIGEQVLPVGMDVWVAESGVAAVGGCEGCALGSKRSSRWPWLGGLSLPLLALHRRQLRRQRGRQRPA